MRQRCKNRTRRCQNRWTIGKQKRLHRVGKHKCSPRLPVGPAPSNRSAGSRPLPPPARPLPPTQIGLSVADCSGMYGRQSTPRAHRLDITSKIESQSSKTFILPASRIAACQSAPYTPAFSATDTPFPGGRAPRPVPPARPRLVPPARPSPHAPLPSRLRTPRPVPPACRPLRAPLVAGCVRPSGGAFVDGAPSVAGYLDMLTIWVYSCPARERAAAQEDGRQPARAGKGANRWRTPPSKRSTRRSSRR